MNQEGIRKGYTFDRLAWSMAIGSILVAIGIVYFVAIWTITSFRNIYSERLDASISSNQFDQSAKYLDSLLQGPPVLGAVNKGEERSFLTGKDIATGLIAVIKSIKSNSLRIAKQQIGVLKNRAKTTPSLPDNTADLFTELETPISAAAEHEQTLETLRQAQTKLTADRSGIRAQFELLAKDTSELFSLPPAGLTEQKIDFYSAGVLANLPKLEGLPDQIPTLDSLREELGKAGGSVHLSGENVAEIFQVKLTALSQSGGELKSATTRLDQQLSAIDAQSKKLATQLETETNSLTAVGRKTLNQLILSLTR